MGRPMAENLLKAGHDLAVFDLVPEKMTVLEASGGARVSSAAEAAARSEVVITMLPDGDDVETAILSPGGVLEGAKPETAVVDMSSINPIVAQKVGAACEAAGLGFLDAPVSGGEPKAIDGTLAIMVGGTKKLFDKVKPVLECMGTSVTLTGAVGAGNFTKLANQIMVAANIAGMGEALTLAAKAGLDPDVVFQAVRGGLAGSTVLEAKAPMVCSRDFEPGFRIRLHRKDLRNTLLAAESLQVPLPLTSLVQQMLVTLINDGKGDLDHSAIVQFTEQMAKTEIRKKS